MDQRWAFLGVCARGSARAIYDYADAGEKLAMFRSPLILCVDPPSTRWDGKLAAESTRKFVRRFGRQHVVRVGTWGADAFTSVDKLVLARGVTHLYIQKGGQADGLLSKVPGVRNCVHAVFDGRSPHGDAYARVSPAVPGTAPVVPHVVWPRASTGGDMREELHIPQDATVFCRHGGATTFSIPFVKQVVLQLAEAHPRLTFLFLNTKRFGPANAALSNVIFLAARDDDEELSRFIRTCDAMLHARADGETFGLAIAEFTAHNRPVITSRAHHARGGARFHLDTLGDAGFYYDDAASLRQQLLGFNRTLVQSGDWRAYKAFAPDKVMLLFRKTFGLPSHVHEPVVRRA